jgi:hypothetical protein
MYYTTHLTGWEHLLYNSTASTVYHWPECVGAPSLLYRGKSKVRISNNLHVRFITLDQLWCFLAWPSPDHTSHLVICCFDGLHIWWFAVLIHCTLFWWTIYFVICCFDGLCILWYTGLYILWFAVLTVAEPMWGRGCCPIEASML